MIPTPPSVNDYTGGFYSFSSTSSKAIICYLCGCRFQGTGRWFEVIGNFRKGFYFCPCSQCENKIDELIESIFPKEIREKITIKHILPIETEHLQNANVNWHVPEHRKQQQDAYLVIKSKEYLLFSETVRAMSIWEKPEVKL